MNNRRWYPVSRLAPEQIKASRHAVDPSMTVPLPGVHPATDPTIASHHIAGRGSSIPGRSRRAGRLRKDEGGDHAPEQVSGHLCYPLPSTVAPPSLDGSLASAGGGIARSHGRASPSFLSDPGTYWDR